MMTKCVECSELTQLSMKRGTRMAHASCPRCGGKLVRATWDPESKTYVVPAKRVGKAGVKVVECAVCGKKRRVPGGARMTTKPMRFYDKFGSTNIVDLPEGSPVCWQHFSVEVLTCGRCGENYMKFTADGNLDKTICGKCDRKKRGIE